MLYSFRICINLSFPLSATTFERSPTAEIPITFIKSPSSFNPQRQNNLYRLNARNNFSTSSWIKSCTFQFQLPLKTYSSHKWNPFLFKKFKRRTPRNMSASPYSSNGTRFSLESQWKNIVSGEQEMLLLQLIHQVYTLLVLLHSE